jgi:uncharacterized protein
LSLWFVDTSAFLALADRGDGQHARAKSFLRASRRAEDRFVTSSDVFDETVTIVRRRVGHATAVRVGSELQSSRWCQLIEVGEELRREAWDLFVRYDDKLFSLTDCTSFATMRKLGIAGAFTFDDDFVAAGFTVVPSTRSASRSGH